MKYNWLNNIKFMDPNYPMDITDEVREKLSAVHPSMIIGSDSFELYMVDYSYTTKRGNNRDGIKFMFIPESELPQDQDDESTNEIVKNEFENFFKKYNKENPWRAISNIVINGICLYANAELALC